MFTINESQTVIQGLPHEFDSHDFIHAGALQFPSTFLALLRKYKGDFTIIDQQIGSFLLRNESALNIKKVNTRITETIIGTQSECAVWNKQK